MVFQGWFKIVGTDITSKGKLVMRPRLKIVHLELARRYGSFSTFKPTQTLEQILAKHRDARIRDMLAWKKSNTP